MGAKAFSGDSASAYHQGPRRQVPGFEALHRMASILLAEKMPVDGRLLVLGAGGGLEIRALATDHKGWSFQGVDPSADMLRLADRTVAAFADRVSLCQGYIADAPAGPYDGATSLLTFHFIPRGSRLETLREIHARLVAGAPLVLAHLSFPQSEPERSAWIARHVAFGADEDSGEAQIENSRRAIATHLTILSPEEEEDMLRQAGFRHISLFYAGLGFRGWVAYADGVAG